LGFLFIGVPLVLASIMPLIGKLSKRVLPDLLTNLALLFLLVYSLTFGRQMLGSGSTIQQLFWFGQPIHIILALDGFSLFMLFTISLVSLCVCLFSVDYMEHYGSKANYYALFLIMIAGMNGLVLATDLFGIYLFLEVAAVASYGLVAYGLGQDELEASYKYLMLSAVASAFILLSIALIFGMTGRLDLSGVADGLKMLDGKTVTGFCLALFLAGFGLKAAIVPFHSWLPDAHPSAPAPISAMLSGLLIKVSGIYAMTRIFFNVFGMNPALSTVLLALGVISIVVGALLALRQNDIKRMLAYSSISQIGYILLGIGLGTPLGLLGALFHVFNHAVAKALLFLDSGSIERATGTRSLDQMGGLARRMPVTAATSVIGSLSIAGVPPLNGFWSKLIILIALVEAKMYGVALIAVLASVMTLWYYLLFQRRAFFGKLNETLKDVKEAPFWMTASTLILGFICIAVGILFPVMIRSWLKPAVDILSTSMGHLSALLIY
jgi:multicomponent Na+:H+ antiporter subunit D